MNSIKVSKLNQLMKTESVIFVDVRQSNEYRQGHIPNAINIPLNLMSKEIINELQTEKVVLYCNTGARSKVACNAVIDSKNKTKILNLEGGIVDWRNQGLKEIA